MTMAAKGLAKLIEESGELQEALSLLQVSVGRLQQVAGKKLAYFHTDAHPDGAGSLKTRLEDEMADVDAAIHFVAEALGLDEARISQRVKRKYDLFRTWHARKDNNADGVDRLESP